MANNRTISIKCNSQRAFASLTQRLTTGLPRVAEDVVSKGTLAIERSAKQNAPVRTGRLRDSIHSKIESNSTGSVGRVSTNLGYA